jgi:hypothetical protein
MKIRKLLAMILLFAMPVFAVAQGHGQGKGKAQGQGQGQQKIKGKGSGNKEKMAGQGEYKGKQGTYKVKRSVATGGKTTGVRRHGPPSWAPAHGYRANKHAYFPDYYTYYDPNRGYVYWNNNTWVTSRTIPSFLTTVNLGKARIQVLNDLNLSTRPESNYSTYMRLYPANRVDITVPVPTVR